MSEEVKVGVLLLLQAYPKGILLADLPRAFQELHGCSLDLSSFGHSLGRLVDDMADTLVRQTVGGQQILFPSWPAASESCSDPRKRPGPRSGPCGLARPEPVRPTPSAACRRTELGGSPLFGPPPLGLPRAPVPMWSSASRPQACGQGPRYPAAHPVPNRHQPRPAQVPKHARPSGRTPGPVPPRARRPGPLALERPKPASAPGGAAQGEAAPAPRPLTYSQAVKTPWKARPGPAAARGDRPTIKATDSTLNANEWPSAIVNRRSGLLPEGEGVQGKLASLGNACEPPQRMEQQPRMGAVTSRAQDAMDGGELADWFLEVLGTKCYRDGLRVTKLAKLSLVERRQELDEMLTATGYDSLTAFLAHLPEVEVVTDRGPPNNFLIRLRPSFDGQTQETPNAETPPVACSPPNHISSAHGTQGSSESASGQNFTRQQSEVAIVSPSTIQLCRTLAMSVLTLDQGGLTLQAFSALFRRAYGHDLLDLVTDMGYRSLVDFLQEIPGARLIDVHCLATCRVQLAMDGLRESEELARDSRA
ncbi:uncharacterized protein, partial [Scyliorhinus torazame]|uniref:uncharacterized protein n=1 Tax=Scyliorhinus torazame TaxID=75743 RepID=UPI003B58C678